MKSLGLTVELSSSFVYNTRKLRVSYINFINNGCWDGKLWVAYLGVGVIRNISAYIACMIFFGMWRRRISECFSVEEKVLCMCMCKRGNVQYNRWSCCHVLHYANRKWVQDGVHRKINKTLRLLFIRLTSGTYIVLK